MKDYRVYVADDVDEVMIGNTNDLDEACAMARDAWDKMTKYDKSRNEVRVLKYLYDIDDEDCTCFDSDSYDWFIWYAVTVGDDNDHGMGSFDWNEAYSMACELAENDPDSEIRICTVDYRDDYCIEEESLEDIKGYMNEW